VPAGSELVVIDGGFAVTAIVSVWLAVAPVVSLTFTLKLKLPAVLGVPEICPLVAASTSPGGGEPVAIDHVYPGVPPEAVTVAE